MSPPATCTPPGQLGIFLGSPLAMGCVTGLKWDETNAKLVVPSLGLTPMTTAERDVLSAEVGDLVYNSTTGRVEALEGDYAWHGKLRKDGDVMTGNLEVPKLITGTGTTSAPSISATGYSNTGVYFNSSPAIAFTLAGVTKAALRGSYFQTGSGYGFGIVSGGAAGAGTADSILTSPSAATWQLGAANAAAPVGQRLRSQGAATGTDIAGADLNISPGPMTGTGANYAAGRYGALRLGTYIPGTTGTTTSTTTTDRLVIAGRPIVLTAGSATNIVHIDIPALAGASWDITYSVKVTDSAAPVQMKVLGGRYYGSAYRLAAGNAVPNAVTETGDNEVHSVGGAASDVMTFTGDATGIMVAHNITVGTGLTAPNTVVGSYMITVSGAAAITVTPQ